jgi:hypothetical protein
MANLVVAVMVKEFCREVVALLGLKSRASKPFFLPCSFNLL